jgi:hypothetical protein
MESLIAVTVEALEAAGLQRSQLQPALLEKSLKVAPATKPSVGM